MTSIPIRRPSGRTRSVTLPHFQKHHLTSIVPAIDQPAASFDAVFFVRGASHLWAAITVV